MIVENLINAFMQLLAFVINSLPLFEPLDWLSDGVQLVQWIAWVNYYLPMEDFFSGAIYVIGVWAVSAVVRVVIDLL